MSEQATTSDVITKEELEAIRNDPRPWIGFEFDGEFVPFHLTDLGKDLQVIDRLTGGMPPHEFFDATKDLEGRARGPVQLGLLGTSLRAHHPEWSVSRICSLIEGTPFSDFVYVKGEPEEEADVGPPSQLDVAVIGESSSTSNDTLATPSEPSSESPS